MSVRSKGFRQYLTIKEALDRFFEEVPIERLGEEEVQLLDGLGRVLSENVYATIDVPSFDRAAVDGYAVKAENTYGATLWNPVVFDLIGVVETGQAPSEVVSDFQAIKIFTGAPMPSGADSIIMLEYTVQIAPNKIEVVNSVTPWKNVSRRGEDIVEGDKILSEGLTLRSQDIGVLASIGRSSVKVSKKPRIAVLSTGNELVESIEALSIGKIMDSNQYAIISAVRESGCEAVVLGIAIDDQDQIRSRIVQGLEKADMVLTIGGTSVGQKDLVPEVVKSLGGPGIIVHGIAMKPGTPTALAAIDGKPLVLLPGNPVAAYIAFIVFVRKIIAKMLGTPDSLKNFLIHAKLSRRVPSTTGMKSFVRVLIRESREGYIAEPLRIAGAGVFSSIVRANGLLVIPENREGFEEGEEVEITILRDALG